MLEGRIKQVDTSVGPVRASAPERRTYDVWLRWHDDLTELHRRTKPAAVMEQFTMVRARASKRDPSLYICTFAHAGRSIDMDRQSVALLRRLSSIAPWVKAERHDVPSAPREPVDEKLWHDLYRRVLP